MPTSISSLTLESPVDNANVSGESTTPFIWFWSGPKLQEGQGFEVRIWKENEPHFGAYDANRQKDILHQPEGKFELSFLVKSAYSVNLHRTGEYYWTVAIVQIDPYDDKPIVEAIPRKLQINVIGETGGNEGKPVPPTPTPRPP